MYIDQANLANDPTFQNRTKEAFKVAAIAIYNELTTVPGHAVRAQFATRILNEQMNLIPLIAAVAAADLTLAAASSDAQIESAVASIWNALAGV